MRTIGLAAILLLASLQLAHAGGIKGAGATSCGSWVEDRKMNNHFAQLNWVLGFISGYNQFAYSGSAPNGIFGNADPNAIAGWLDNYCRENPLDTVYEGSVQLVKELQQRVGK